MAARRLLAVTLLALCTGGAAAQSVSLAGSIGDSKALLMIDGTPHTLAVGATVKGVTLRRVMPGQAEVEVGGRRLALAMGGAPSRVGGGGAAANGREIVIAAGPGGHFVASGLINGKPVQLMVDTGATSVAMSRGDAERVGVDWKRGQLTQSQTAGGVVPVHIVSLNSIRIGDVELFNVPAAVVASDMPVVLLGNSFLGRFSMRRESDVLRLERRD
jgi:aspartyl protease family protein